MKTTLYRNYIPVTTNMRVDNTNRNMVNEIYVIYTGIILVVLIVLACFILYITDTDSENDTFGNYGTTYYTLRHTINAPEPSGSFVSFDNSLNDTGEDITSFGLSDGVVRSEKDLNEQIQQNEETLKTLQNTNEKTNKRKYIKRNKKRYANSIEGIVNIV